MLRSHEALEVKYAGISPDKRSVVRVSCTFSIVYTKEF